ncbi:HNH endonuclease family protein [Agromyces sp. MMS24-JH15]|uniref:HNH endonuclease family protein n=1 Tax=Agromyces sp. MMS24-JH15 TaxID=3243765 RepID=UPI0037480B15
MPPSRRRRTTTARTRRLSGTSLLLIVLVIAFVWFVLPELQERGILAQTGEGAAGSSAAPVAPGSAPGSAPSDAELAALVVADGDPAAPYDRDLFGAAWADVDGNGCDTRNDVLIRDLVDVVFRADSNGCIVRTGRLVDAYTGAVIAFVRGPDTSEAVQIDHVVPLSYAWRHGADAWTPELRAAFANDPANLQAVDGPTNQSKSDSGPGEWMPPAAAYACAYVDRFAGVLAAYDLTVAPADYDAMVRVEAGCG